MQCNIFLKRRGGSFEKLKSLSVSCGGKCQCRNTRRGERISPEMKFLLSNQTKKKRGQDETDCWDWGLSRSSGYCSKSTTKDLAVTIIYNFRGSASLYSLFILKTSIVRILNIITFLLLNSFLERSSLFAPRYYNRRTHKALQLWFLTSSILLHKVALKLRIDWCALIKFCRAYPF